MEKILRYFDVKVEVMVPAVVVHKILAETPEEALAKAERGDQPINDVQYSLVKRKNVNMAVYDSGTHNLHIRKKA